MDNSKFNTMALALAAAYGPAQGITAFIGFVLAHNLNRFVLIEQEEYCGEKRVYWFKDLGNGQYEGEWGGPHVLGKNDKILKHVDAASFSDLDWKQTSYYVEKGESGWLNPQGEFWGCYYGGHSSLARRILNMDYADLERDGWVHVDEAGAPNKYSWRMLGSKRNAEPTPAQAKWLKDHGHDLDPFGKRAAKKAEMLRLGEYEIDAAADRAAFERMMARAPKRY